MAADSTDRYELTGNQSTAGMWTIIRDYVRRGADTYPALLHAMMKRDPETWPERVKANPSKQGIGTQQWCHGYINGALRKGFIRKV